MPPKKRKAAAAASKSSGQPAKKVKIGDTSIIDDTSRASTPSGRPRRSTSNDTPQYNFTRKKNVIALEEGPQTPAGAKATAASATSNGAVKRRGRPPKVAATPEDEETTTPRPGILKNGRGRPRKSSTSTSTRALPTSSAARAAKRRASITSPPASPAPKRVAASGTKKRGRPSSIPKTTEASSAKAIVSLEDANVNGTNPYDEDEVDDENIQYWLMKAEPNSRIEKGVDVKFSIDDLAAKSEPEGWDGVRNPAARNNMRAMRAGDLAFFYHSNCTVPGIAGVMRIVEEHSVDESAFDPAHPYYDPKSTRDKPKWELVKVEFVKKFNELITLRELKSFAEKGGALEHMQMLRQGRLSVSSVQPIEWRFILDLAEESHSLGQPEPADGYESDTDGETEIREDAGVKTGGRMDGQAGSIVDQPVGLDQDDLQVEHV